MIRFFYVRRACISAEANNPSLTIRLNVVFVLFIERKASAGEKKEIFFF
jgi:hypothetical protein